jgi:predicted RNA-binding Zn ribbon-like protein
MRYDDYSNEAVELAIALANGFWRPADHAALVRAGERFVAAHRQLAREHSVPDRPMTDKDLAEFEHLAGRIRLVICESDETAALERLNQLLECCETAPRVSVHDGSAHVHYAPDNADFLDWVAANAAMGLAMAVCAHGRDRLGVCAAESCGNVYVDASKNRSRRYCSDTCASRTTVRALRSRRAVAKSAAAQ